MPRPRDQFALRRSPLWETAERLWFSDFDTARNSPTMKRATVASYDADKRWILGAEAISGAKCNEYLAKKAPENPGYHAFEWVFRIKY